MAESRQRKVVVGIDGTPGSESALEWAIQYAREGGAQVVAAFALELAPSAYYPADTAVVTRGMADAEEGLLRDFERSWCEPLRQAHVSWKAAVGRGPASRWLAELAEREDADLVVVGRRGLNAVAEIFLGSVSRQLSHTCTVPLVLVPAAFRAAHGQAEAKAVTAENLVSTKPAS